MHYYRLYFIQKDGELADWRSFQGADDGEARDHALGLLAGFPHADKLEVWDDTALVFGYDHSGARTPGELRKLCHLAIAAAEKETDPEIKRIIASRSFALAQEAEALERGAEDILQNETAEVPRPMNAGKHRAAPAKRSQIAG